MDFVKGDRTPQTPKSHHPNPIQCQAIAFMPNASTPLLELLIRLKYQEPALIF